MTVWETFSPEPNWQMDNSSDSSEGSYAGWHTFVVQVNHGQVKYYVDGVLRASQGGKFYPEVPMSINFNLWFIRDGLIQAEEIREYAEDVDWVYFEGGQALSPQEVEAKVAALRQSAVKFKTVEEEIMDAHPEKSRGAARKICGIMMFPGDHELKKINVISGGEKSRVLWGKLLVSPSNMLMLDEPKTILIWNPTIPWLRPSTNSAVR